MKVRQLLDALRVANPEDDVFVLVVETDTCTGAIRTRRVHSHHAGTDRIPFDEAFVIEAGDNLDIIAKEIIP